MLKKKLFYLLSIHPNGGSDMSMIVICACRRNAYITFNLPSRRNRRFYYLSRQKQQEKRTYRSLFLSTEKPPTPTDIGTFNHTTTLNTNTQLYVLLWIEEEISLDTKRLSQTLSANNYPSHFFRGQQSHTERETSANVVVQRD